MTNDITFQQLRDSSPEDIQPLLELIMTSEKLPQTLTVGEFIFKTLKGARKAALAVNTALSNGEKIIGYPQANNTAVQVDNSTDEDYYFKIASVQVRINSDDGSATVTNGEA